MSDFPCGKKKEKKRKKEDQGCFKPPYQLPTSLSDSHGILEHRQRPSLWSGFGFLLICCEDLLVFQSIIGHREEQDDGSTTTPLTAPHDQIP